MKKIVLLISICTLLPIVSICLSVQIDTTPVNPNYLSSTDSIKPHSGKIELVNTTQQGIKLQIIIAESDIKIDTLERNSKQFQTISFPQCRYTSTLETYRLPMQTALIGVPTDVSFTLHVVDSSDFSTYKLEHNLADHSTYYRQRIFDGEQFNQESSLVQKGTPNHFSPQHLAEIGTAGWIRENRVLPIQLNPVQYNPATRVVKVYHRLVVEVRFNRLANAPSAIQAVPRPESSVYENLFENLLVNPQTAKMWRSPISGSLDNNRGSKGILDDHLSPLFAPSAPTITTPRYKVMIKEAGMYRITASDLASAGADISSIRPDTLTLTNKGKQIPIYVRNAGDGQTETDGNNSSKGFDADAEIIFYGQRHSGEKSYFDPYSDVNVYWLSWNNGPGLRMDTQILSDDIPILPDGTFALSQPKNFLTRVHVEKDLQFRRFKNFGLPEGSRYDDFGDGFQQRYFGINALPDLPDDSWFWAQISAPQTRAFTFNLKGVAGTGQKATIRVVLHGRSENAHFTELWLNNDIILGRPRWIGDIEQRVENREISQSTLKDGRNTINLVSPGENELDLIMLNWFEIDYWRTYEATGNVLPFSITLLPDDLTGIIYSDFKVNLKNFTNPNIEIYGIDGTRYVGLFPIEDEDNPGIYNVDFQSKRISGVGQQPPELNPTTQYIALTRDKYLKPETIIKDTPSDLRSIHNGADYIIITDTEFIRDVQPLANFRSQQGLQTKIVDVEDIYDEFNHGISNPYAVRDFLKYTYENWQSPAPTYVLLFGDTNPKERTSFVPTIQIQVPGYGSSASDHQFVSIRGSDSYPDMLVGRVPATNSVDARIFVERAINYESTAKVGPWHKRILMLAGSDEDFHVQTDSLIHENHLNDKYETKQIYAPATAEEELTLGEGITPVGRQVINGFNDGASLVNYVGHGGGGRWASSRMMDLEDPHKNLTNIAQLPFVISMTCFTGEFDSPSGCLAEELLRSESGGAIGVIGGTSIGLLIQDHILNIEIFEVIFNDNEKHLGAIIAEAKTQFLINSPGYLDLAEVFTLFGDPATSLKIPHTKMQIETAVKNPSKQDEFTTDTVVSVLGTLQNQTFSGDAEITIIPNSPERSTKKKRTEQRSRNINVRRSIDNDQRMETVSVIDGKFETEMLIPYNSEFDALKIRVYAWNNEEDAIGYTSYTPLERYVKNIRVEPDPIVANQPVHIYADVVDESLIEEITLFWSLQVIEYRDTDLNTIPLVKHTGTTFRTKEPIPAYDSGTEVDYYLLVKPKDGRLQHTEVVTYLVGEPNLTVLEHTINWGSDASFHLSAHIANNGSINAKDVPVRFFQMPVTDSSETPEITFELLQNATPIGNVQILPEIVAEGHVPVSVPWKPNPGKYLVIIYVDMPSEDKPDGILTERRETDNSASQVFENNRVFLTSEHTNKPLQSPDGLFRIAILEQSLQADSVLTFDTEELSITNQPDIKHALTATETTIPLAYRLDFSQAAELTGTVTFVKPTEEDLYIYVRDEETRNWIRVGKQTDDGENISAKVKLPGTFALLSHSDTRPPTLTLTVDNQGFIDGDYISDTPTISAKVEDANGIDPRPDNLILSRNGNRIPQTEYTVSVSPTNSNVLLITYSPVDALQAGEYRIRLQAQDANGNVEDTQLNAKVAGGFEIKNIANFPNPFRPGTGSGKGTNFAYYLTGSADKVSLKIYTLTGKLITTVDTLDAATSYNEYHFDGLDADGEPLANGVYIYKFTATKGEVRTQRIGKILVIK